MADHSSNQRIIGGINATAPVPWQISLLRRDSTNDPPFLHNCGGTIIDRKTILTAAHCFMDEETRQLITDVNEFTLSFGIVQKDNTNNELIKPKNITLHESYEYGQEPHDIAIIKLQEPLEYGENIGPACLPKKLYDPKAGTDCFISG